MCCWIGQQSGECRQPPKAKGRRGLEKEERRGKEKRGGGRVIFIGVLLFILELGAGLAFFFPRWLRVLVGGVGIGSFVVS